MILVRGLAKSFPGVRALHNVDLRLDRGEVLAVVGENGAGKSTLMKILAGVQTADAGEIRVNEATVTIASVRDATALGIALIHQELNLCDNLSVAANIFLGREPRSRFRIDDKQIRARAIAVLARIGLDVDPSRLLGSLSLGQQQLVEIGKALAGDASILIMDEPTSSLSQTESERLFAVIDELRRSDVGIIYISHRLGEVKRLADRVTVLRDGENAGELRGAAIDHEAMVALMVGRDVKQLYQHQPRPPGEIVLNVEGLRTSAYPDHPIDLTVRAGEVVGLAGLVGAGRSELLRTLFGVDPWVTGVIEIRSTGGGSAGGGLSSIRLRKHGPAVAIAAGMMLAPEDRRASGLIMEQSVLDNLRLARLCRDRGRGGFVGRRGFDTEAQTLVDRLGIRTPGLGQEVGVLSGGNQQKVVLGKWLAMEPGVLLLDEPTRGIDVSAKAEIYQLMDQLAAAGVAVLFASSEMEEVLGMADRILVMHEGRVAGELARAQFSEEAVMLLATGKAAVA